MRRLAWLFLAACSSGTTTDVVHGTALDHGRALFSDPRASDAVANPFACATCHPGGDAPGRVFPGGSLAGVTSRTTFWGGQRDDLLESVNDCRLSFMDAPAPWTTDDEDAKAMYAYLASLGGPPAPIAFTPVPKAPDLPPGDAAQGKTLFEVTCRPCHGALRSGDGRLATFIPRLPDDVDSAHGSLALADRRLVYLRKIREGAFRDGAGSMPPFSREALSDSEVGSLLAFLGQY